ncbi:MAG: tetratricopeptide repeat protein [Polyangiales bacterium]
MTAAIRRVASCFTLVFAFACASSPPAEPSATTPAEAATTARTAPLLEGMGDLHWQISSQSELAQRYFDQALTLAYGFNHLEAERSFREAARLDESCAICLWGAALVLGPNINDPVPTPERETKAYQTLSEAVARSPHASDKERALIEALETRYSATPPANRASLDQAYADAMRSVANRFPDDLQIQTLFAEAMMDTMPWAYWTEDGKPKPLTEEVFATLDYVVERDPDHPGANHFYIHAVEQEQPERGVTAADNLRRVVPGAGHLVHMPSHIYIRVGRYHDGSTANEHAIEADNDYVTQCRAQGIYPVAYVPHNHHFLWATTTMEGRSADALDAARHTAQHVDRSLMREPQMGMLQHFSAIPYYALVRFGKWQEILDEPAPDEDLLYPTAVWHYARGIAYARGDRLKDAGQELRQVQAIAADSRLEEIRIWGLNPTSSLAAIAAAVLRAEIAAARGDIRTAVAQLRKAVAIEDGLIYGEPPDWFYPVRHNLGAILLEAGRHAAAEKVYRADLARFPDNGWSLFGLAQSLRAQGKKEKAADVQRRFEMAWKHADVEITASRF